MSRKYWEQREYEKLRDQLKDISVIEEKLRLEFGKASKEIQKYINHLFIKFAEDNELTYTEASRLLTSSEFKSWRYDLKTYIKLIEATSDEKLLLELNSLAMKSRISRLEELKYQIDKKIDSSYYDMYSLATEFLTDSVSENYYKTIYNIQKYTGIATSFCKVNEELIKDILSYPWSGKNYSQRIWKNRDKLKDILETEMTQMIIRGESSRTISKRVAEVMDVSYKNAIALINTEHSYVMGEASAKAYEETGVEEYEFVATLDKRTSKVCQSLDGEIFKLSERQVGVNASPMHTRCRSTEIPSFDNYKSKRFARDKNDKAIEVPASMKYKEWYETFIENE